MSWTPAASASSAGRKGAPRGHWTAGRVRWVVNSTAYRGEYVAERKLGAAGIVPVPAIVDAALWQAANDALAASQFGKHVVQRTQHVYLCDGISVCAVCGANMVMPVVRVADR